MELRMPDPCTIHQWCIYPHWHIPHIWLVFMVHVVQIGFKFNFRDLRSDWFDFDLGFCQWAVAIARLLECYALRFPAISSQRWSLLATLEPLNGGESCRLAVWRPFGVRFLDVRTWPKMSKDREQTKSRTRRTSNKKGLPEMAPRLRILTVWLPWIGTSRSLVTSVTSHSQLMLD